MYHDKNYIETQCTITLYSKITHLCYDPHPHWNLRVIAKLETSGLCFTEASTESSCWCPLNGLLFYVCCVRNLSHHLILTRKQVYKLKSNNSWIHHRSVVVPWKETPLPAVCMLSSYLFWHSCQVTYRTNSRNKLSLLPVSEDLSPPRRGKSSEVQGSTAMAAVFTSGQIQKRRTRATLNPSQQPPVLITKLVCPPNRNHISTSLPSDNSLSQPVTEK